MSTLAIVLAICGHALMSTGDDSPGLLLGFFILIAAIILAAVPLPPLP